jgi:hypothetical protein
VINDNLIEAQKIALDMRAKLPRRSEAEEIPMYTQFRDYWFKREQWAIHAVVYQNDLIDVAIANV